MDRQIFPMSHHRGQLRICSRKVDRLSRGALKNLAKPAENLLKQVKACQNLDDLQNLPFPADLAVAWGREVTGVLVTGWMQGKKSGRRLRRRIANSQAVDELIEFSWDLPSLAAVSEFRQQAFTVAGVESGELLDNLKQAAAQTLAKGGTFADFRGQARLEGFEAANPYHLRTNFDTAVNSAYQAARWETIEETREFFPYLRYVTMNDDKVRDEHAALEGLTLPVDDPFWLTSYPPNDWNCRCSVEQLTAAEGGPLDGRQNRADAWREFSPGPQWNTNPGRTNQLFGDYDKLKEAKAHDWREYKLSPWTALPDSKPRLTNLDGLSKNQIIEQYRLFLGDRIVQDGTGAPVLLDAQKAFKFNNKRLEDIQGRLKYMRCIDETLASPTELWFNPHDKRYYYLKKYDRGIALLAEINKDNVLEYFNLLRYGEGEIDKKRFGVLFHK